MQQYIKVIYLLHIYCTIKVVQWSSSSTHSLEHIVDSLPCSWLIKHCLNTVFNNSTLVALEKYFSLDLL